MSLDSLEMITCNALSTSLSVCAVLLFIILYIQPIKFLFKVVHLHISHLVTSSNQTFIKGGKFNMPELQLWDESKLEKSTKDKFNLQWLRTSMSYHRFSNFRQIFQGDTMSRKLPISITFKTLNLCPATAEQAKMTFMATTKNSGTQQLFTKSSSTTLEKCT